MILKICVLIIGNFNIHPCGPDKPMAMDFSNLIDSFDLVQFVFGHTQECGYTLDLVLLWGLPVFNLKICDWVSDHMPVLFVVPVVKSSGKWCADVQSCRIINPSTAAQFSIAFLFRNVSLQ